MKRGIGKSSGPVAAVVAACIVLVGCGGSNEDSSGPSTDDSATTVASQSESDPSSTESAATLPDFGYEGGNLLKVFKDNELFSTFLSVVDEAGLTDLLEGDQPLTIFAPANKAFDDLPDGVLEKLKKPENHDLLVQIVKYHIIEGLYRATEITQGTLTTLQGSGVEVEKFSTADFTKLLMVNGKYVLLPNIDATNGTIHVINWILLPPGVDLGTL